MVRVIISGGQTGVDRAALDTALASGFRVGGWCPRGRRAEDGEIDARYPLRETPSEAYEQRTAWNVRDSDATLVLCLGSLTGGTALTVREAEQQGKPCRVEHLPGVVKDVRQWIDAHGVKDLNVAGPRASEAPGLYEAAAAFMQALLNPPDPQG